MSESPNKLIKFWQELKRRKVIGVVTTYAATAYIIIEVINNLAFPLNLPAWFATLILVILVIGLPIVIILAWIFDFTPKGIEKTESLEESKSTEPITRPVKRKLRASYVLNAILIIAVIVLAYPKIFKRNTLEKLRSSGERITVAVMPFQNMTNDTTWDVWQDGIQDNLITYLSDYENLKVRQTESVNSLLKSSNVTEYASITPSIALNFSRRLNSNILITGSINKAGGSIRVNAKVTDTETEESLNGYQIDGISENILHIIDSLSAMISNTLQITELAKDRTPDWRKLASSDSPEAYQYYILGDKAMAGDDYMTAVKFYSLALEADSNFLVAEIKIALAYYNSQVYDHGAFLHLEAAKKAVASQKNN